MSEKSTPESRTDERRANDPDVSSPAEPARAADVNPKTAPDPSSNAEKDPADWVSGDEPMTGAQASYLKTLSEETGADAFKPDLTKAEASTLIDELKTARNQSR